MLKKKLIILLSACVLIILSFILFGGEKMNHALQVKDEPDLSKHAVYSSYEFSADDSVINIGVQPLYLPSSWIFEVIRRDTLLKKQISKLGMELRFFSFLKGADVNFFLKRKHLDGGVGGDMPALTMAANDSVIIPALVQYGFTSIVAIKPMLIDELRGKRIGYCYGSNAHYSLLNVLNSEGLTEDDVQLVSMEASEMPEALQSGRVDAFSCWEPNTALTLEAIPGSSVIYRGNSTGYLYFRKSFAQKHPEVVRQIVAAEIRAIGWLQVSDKNLEVACEYGCEAAEILSGHVIDLPHERVAALAMTDILGLTTVPYIPTVLLKKSGPLHREFEFLKALGGVPNSSDWNIVKNSFDNCFLESVLEETEKYTLEDFKCFADEGGSNE